MKHDDHATLHLDTASSSAERNVTTECLFFDNIFGIIERSEIMLL